MTVHRDWPCQPENYQGKRVQGIKYLVIHYVGALGDAEQNAYYYGTTPEIGASAHYFVDHGPEAEVWASVAEDCVASHCGRSDGRYKHSECRNANSIGIEMCCRRRADGTWYFDDETVDATVELARDIMARYGIDVHHVLRHYDVTGKICPAPFVNDPVAWEEFLGRLGGAEGSPHPAPVGPPGGELPQRGKRGHPGVSPGGKAFEEEKGMKLYRYVAEMPEWARAVATKAINNGYIKMDGTGAVGVWEANLQALVWMDRAGLLDTAALKE